MNQDAKILAAARRFVRMEENARRDMREGGVRRDFVVESAYQDLRAAVDPPVAPKTTGTKRMRRYVYPNKVVSG